MNDAFLLAAPVVLPIAAGLLLLTGRDRPGWQRGGLVAATGANLLAAAALAAPVLGGGRVLAVAFGGWSAPVGIAFHADALSATMVLVSAAVAFAGAVYASAEIGRSLWRRRYAFFYLLLLAGIAGAFLTADLFNLFVWFETMLMSSFAMMALGRRRRTRREATVYVAINVVSSFFFLSALGILYGKAGSLNLADLAGRLAAEGGDALVLTSAALLLLAFGIKAGAFPLFFWLPDSYPQTGYATSAVFGGLLTKVGVYAIFRVFGGTFAALGDTLGPVLLAAAAATMVAGVLGAASRHQVREILSWHIVSQIGYLLLGFALFTEAGLAAAVFYTVHHIFVKANLFFAAGLVARAGGSERLASLGGLLRERPLLALLFAVPALSLGGIPPLSGFFAKFFVVRECFRSGEWVWAAVALAVGVLTLFSMTKIWAEAFWKNPVRPSPRRAPLPPAQLGAVLALGLVTVWIGLAPGALHRISLAAAEQVYAQRQPDRALAESSGDLASDQDADDGKVLPRIRAVSPELP